MYVHKFQWQALSKITSFVFAKICPKGKNDNSET